MKQPYFFYADHMDVGYDGKALITSVKIKVQRGEILTLIGPNGAGKSTILKSITRQLKLIGGTVYLDGRDLQQMPGRDLARSQAVLLTERIRPEMMTCADVVGTGRYPYTGTLGLLSAEDHEKVRQSLELVHAADLADRDFGAISDGQRQRVMLARALCQEPELIVLDEPTSFLDIRHKLEFLTILRQMVRERQMAVVMSLHELDLAQKISDRVLCVNGPHVERCGPPEEVFEPEYIRRLYGMERGSYDALFGCMELPAPEGACECFVICGGGSGIPLFRKLQRENIPFAAGILPENDIDYEAARHLATQVLSSPAYEPVSEEMIARALEVLRGCRQVICTLERTGSGNQYQQVLTEEARDRGLLVV